MIEFQNLQMRLEMLVSDIWTYPVDPSVKDSILLVIDLFEPSLLPQSFKSSDETLVFQVAIAHVEIRERTGKCVETGQLLVSCYLEFVAIECEIRHCKVFVGKNIKLIWHLEIEDFVVGQVECLNLVSIL